MSAGKGVDVRRNRIAISVANFALRLATTECRNLIGGYIRYGMRASVVDAEERVSRRAQQMYLATVRSTNPNDDVLAVIDRLDVMHTCHCGEPVRYGFDGNPDHHRGMCEECDQVRCDAYPGECGR